MFKKGRKFTATLCFSFSVLLGGCLYGKGNTYSGASLFVAENNVLVKLDVMEIESEVDLNLFNKVLSLNSKKNIHFPLRIEMETEEDIDRLEINIYPEYFSHKKDLSHFETIPLCGKGGDIPQCITDKHGRVILFISDDKGRFSQSKVACAVTLLSSPAGQKRVNSRVWPFVVR